MCVKLNGPYQFYNLSNKKKKKRGKRSVKI